MSTIARAFTTRRVKLSTDAAAAAKERQESPFPQRSNTTAKAFGNPSIRNKISGPLELIHTTNMLSYNAPDIRPAQRETSPASSSSSTKSDDDSDSLSPTNTAASSPPTSPDVSSRSDGSTSPEPNHLSCYFVAPGQQSSSASATGAAVDAPTIPKRAPSHTKKASYEALARSRSNSALNSRMSNQSSRTVSTKASFSFSTGSRVSSASTTASSVSNGPESSHASKPSVTVAAPEVPAIPSTLQRYQQHRQEETSSTTITAHPFGQELAQVTEIAEEYGVRERLQVIDEEERELVAKGLHKFSADDYLSEIHNLINSFFLDGPSVAAVAPPMRHPRPVAAVWI